MAATPGGRVKQAKTFVERTTIVPEVTIEGARQRSPTARKRVRESSEGDEGSALWVELLGLEESARALELGIEAVEQRYNSQMTRLRQRANLSKESAARMVIRAWFEGHYGLPSRGERSAHRGEGGASYGVVRVSRGSLLAQLNSFLVSVGLPMVNAKQAIWNVWFLTEYLGLSEEERASSKPIVLEERLSIVSMRSSFTRALERLSSLSTYENGAGEREEIQLELSAAHEQQEQQQEYEDHDFADGEARQTGRWYERSNVRDAPIDAVV